MKSLEKIVLDYFLLINPSTFKDIQIRFSKNNEICFIRIECGTLKESRSYIKGSDGIPMSERLRQEMEDMFPFGFHINTAVKINNLMMPTS